MRFASSLSLFLTVALALLAGPRAMARLRAPTRDGPIGVAVKIYTRGQGTSGTVTASGTFLESSPGAGDAYASASGTATVGTGYAVAILGTNEFVRVAPGTSYTVSVGGTTTTNREVNVVAPPGYRVIMDHLIRSRETYSTTANVVFEVQALGAKHPGLAGLATSVAAEDIEWRLSLGSLRNGGSAGDLVLSDPGTETSWSAVFTPALLSYEEISDEISVYRPSGAIRQILANQVAVDVVTLTTTSYEIRCYHPSQVTGSSFPYGFTGQAYATYRIEQGATSSTLKFTREIRNVTNATATGLPIARQEVMTLARTGSAWPAYTWTRTDWTVVGQAALEETSVVSGGTTAARTAAITLRAPNNGPVALKVTRNYTVPTVGGASVIGEVLSSETVGTGTGLNASFDYYTDTADFGSLGYLKSSTMPGGGWSAYDYYPADLSTGYRGGRVKHAYRPYLNAPATTTLNAGSGDVTYCEYVNDLFGAPTRPSLVQETINGTTTSKSTIAYNDSYGTANGFSLAQSTRTDYADATHTLQTLIRYYREDASDGFIRGQTYSQTRPDGEMQAFAYQRGTWDGTTFTPGSGAIGTGTASRVSMVTGSSQSTAGTACPNIDSYVPDTIYLVDGKSTKSVTIRESRALVARTESYVWKNSAWQLVGWTNYTYDFAGRLTNRVGNNGATYSAAYDGGLKTSETNEAGVGTSYTYDAADRILVATRAGSGVIGALATRHAYDAAGRDLGDDFGWGQAEMIVSSRQYDDAGRLTSETPPGLGATTHTYDVANRKHTITRPGAAGASSTTTYLNGWPNATTGSSVVASYHTYGVESDGRQWHKINTGTASSPRWAKAWSDWLGRKLTNEAPGFTGQPDPISQSFYEDGTGHLTKTTQTGYAATLYEYNALGQVSRSGLDVNGNGVLDLGGTDRISESESYLESYKGAWWMRTDTRAYPKAGDDTPITTSIARTELTGFPANRLSETQSVDAEGNVTTQYVDVNRTARTSTASTLRSGIPTQQVETTVNGCSTQITGFDGLTAKTAYDALLRRATVTDSRENTTTTAYYSGTTMTETVTDQAGDVAATVYDTAGRVLWQRDPRNHYTRYAYNTRDQVIHQWGDGSFPVSYGYDDTYGDRTTMSTYRSGTGFDGDTWPSSPGDADTTTWTYDGPSGFLWKKTDAPTTDHPSGKTVTRIYNLRGQLDTRTLARGVSTTYGYDSATGELLSQTYSDDTAPVGYTYNRAGQVQSVSDDTGFRDLIYDADKPWRLTAEAEDQFYGQRVLTRLYDETGMIGRVRGFQLGPVAGSNAELEQTFGFTTIGRFESVSSKRDANASSRTFRYTYRTDSALIAALTIDGNSDFGVAREYEDERDLVTSIDTTWGASSVSRYDYVYNELGQRTSTKQSGSAFADYGDSTFHLYTYDGRGEVTADAGFLGSTVTDQSQPLPGRQHGFGYDNAGNRAWSDRAGIDADHDGLPDLRDTYTSNALNQYTDRSNNTVPVSGTTDPETTPPGGAGGTTVAIGGRTAPAGRQGNYWDDEITVGNVLHPWRGPVTIFTAKRGMGGSVDTFRIDNRLAEIAALLQVFTYDDDGNLLSDGLVDYQWDAENRLIRMETTSNAVSWGFPHKLLRFRYDYMGRRVQKELVDLGTDPATEVYTHRYLYDGWNLIAEYAVSSTSTLDLIRSYTWGLDIAKSLTDAGGVGALLQITDHPTGKSYVPTYDGNGNIVSLLNASTGALAAIYEYGPFGEALRAQMLDSTIADNPFRFSTKWTDMETGLVYYGHRYYSSSLGRFINRDPIEESGGNNLYCFCGSDGVNRWDVRGMVGNRFYDGGDGAGFAPSVEAVVGASLGDLATALASDASCSTPVASSSSQSVVLPSPDELAAGFGSGDVPALAMDIPDASFDAGVSDSTSGSSMDAADASLAASIDASVANAVSTTAQTVAANADAATDIASSAASDVNSQGSATLDEAIASTIVSTPDSSGQAPISSPDSNELATTDAADGQNANATTPVTTSAASPVTTAITTGSTTVAPISGVAPDGSPIVNMGGPGMSSILGFIFGVNNTADAVSNQANLAVVGATDIVAPIIPNFHYTVQIGTTVSGNYANWSVGLVFDSSGRFGWYDTSGGGAAVGANAFAGLSVQASNAGSIQDLGGPFWNGSAGGGDGFDGTIDIFGGQGANGQPVHGGGLTFGLGGGAGTSTGGTLTYIHPIW